jgi:anthranilate phosphoribosyltransferase
VLLRAKGETPAEIAGLARAMRSSGVKVDAGPGVLDIVGTGGDRRARGCAARTHASPLALTRARRAACSAGTVNISTGACVIAAAAGARVAKHGNRSVSSMCGSGDVVEKLGVAVRARAGRAWPGWRSRAARRLSSGQRAWRRACARWASASCLRPATTLP